METTATSKGQIVIPSSVRRKLGIREGTRIHIEVDDKMGRILLKPITREYIHNLRGRLRGSGVTQSLMNEKKYERDI